MDLRPQICKIQSKLKVKFQNRIKGWALRGVGLPREWTRLFHNHICFHTQNPPAAAFGVNTLQSSQHCFEAHKGPVHRTQSNHVVFSLGLERSGSVIKIDIDVNIGLKRTKKRSINDRFEQEEVAFFEKIRKCYLDRAKNEPKRFRVINSELSLDNVKKEITTILTDI